MTFEQRDVCFRDVMLPSMRPVNCKKLGETHATLDMPEPEPAAAAAVAPACTVIGRTASAEMLSGLAALSFGHGVTILETPRVDAAVDPSAGAMGTARLLRLQQRNLRQADAESTEVAIYRIQQALLDKLPSGICHMLTDIL